MDLIEAALEKVQGDDVHAEVSNALDSLVDLGVIKGYDALDITTTYTVTFRYDSTKIASFVLGEGING